MEWVGTGHYGAAFLSAINYLEFFPNNEIVKPLVDEDIDAFA